MEHACAVADSQIHSVPALSPPPPNPHSLSHMYGKNFNTALEVVDEQRIVCYVGEKTQRSVVKVSISESQRQAALSFVRTRF